MSKLDGNKSREMALLVVLMMLPLLAIFSLLLLVERNDICVGIEWFVLDVDGLVVDRSTV